MVRAKTPVALFVGQAAEYVRMSTEHQQYSPTNQLDVMSHYAKGHELSIVKRYDDHGCSGLNLAGRDGLQQLLKDVEEGTAKFSTLLVYDVSRWGRFQDSDESAYYEYILKRAGITVQYCAEQFENDGSMSSSLLKTLKRTMAAEYSRELSVKVFAGQCRLIELGFRQGGPAGYGLRRQLIDRTGAEKCLLQPGERKSFQTDRVILVPGPETELTIVREIFRRFTVDREVESLIAATLNSRGLLSDLGRAWTKGVVHQILTNPKYIGSNVYNRRSFKLKKKRVVNPRQMWIERQAAFLPVVSPEQFAAAEAIIAARHHHSTDDEMLSLLRILLQSSGRLSGILIDEAEDMPSSSLYAARFGGLRRAYQLIGWNPNRDFDYVEVNRRLRLQHADLVCGLQQELKSAGAEVEHDQYSGLLTINGEFTASMTLAKCQETKAQALRWHIRFDTSLVPDITIAVRLRPGNTAVLDYYLLPRTDVLWSKLCLAQNNGVVLDLYRFDNLSLFMGLARRVSLEDVA
jgi:DNA invertase Pin-like site-specific DNA recombinase